MTRNDVLKISEPIETMYADCQAQLLINISKHFAGGYMPTAEWETKMLSEMGALTRESVEIIAANTGQAPEAIRKAITEGMGLEIADTEKVLKGAAKAGKIQGAKESWQASPRVQGVVGSLTAQAKEDFNVVNTVMLESTRNRYAASIQYCRDEEQKLIEKLMSASNIDELDNQLATVQRALNASTASVAIGAEARTQAVRRTIKQLADQGITGYIDAGGHHWSPEAYVNMDVRTTVHNAAIQGQQARSADYGVTTFQISTHAGARPLCEPYQGKFYSWDGTSGTVEDLSGKRYSYESIYETSYGEAAGIFGINCGHSPQTFVDGFSLPRYEPTQDEAKNAEEYALSQRQRYMEREIRQSKTEALCYDAAGDKEAFEKTAAKIKQQNANYKAFCSENGRTPRMDRTQVYGYNRSVSGKASQAAKNAEIKPFTPSAPPAPKVQTPPTRTYKLGDFKDSSYGDKVNSLYDNGDAIARAAWEKLLPSGGVVADYDYSGTPHFSPFFKEVYYNTSNDAVNPRGVGCTFFHENGHAIDSFGGNLSHDQLFKDALTADYKAALKATGKKSVADQRFALSMSIRENEANGVSDICEGLSKGKCVGSYGHGAKYWRNRPDYGVVQEAWAHMYEAAFLDGQRKKIQEFFPTAYDRFLEILKGV